MARSRVLGVAYGGGHANVVIPVLRELERRGHDTVLIALTSAGPQAQRAGIAHRGFRHYPNGFDRRRVTEVGAPPAEQMHNAALGIPLEESITYLGVNLLENEQRLGAVAAAEVWRRAGRQGFLPIEFMKHVLEVEACDVVVTTNSPRSETAALIAANELGIPSVRIDDLYGVPIIRETLLRRLGGELYERAIGRYTHRPDLMCFMCEYARDNFLERQTEWNISGVSREQTRVTGQPTFDEIDRIVTKPADLELVAVQAAAPTVVWAHENGHPDNDEVLGLTTGWHEQHSEDFNLVLKVRPNLSALDCDQLVAKFRGDTRNLRVVHDEIDPNLVLWNSQVVLGQESTMLTQAAYMGRPVIVMDPSDRRSDNPLLIKRVAPVARSIGDLDALVRELVDPTSAAYDAFLSGRESMGFVSNGATNVANAIDDLLRAPA